MSKKFIQATLLPGLLLLSFNLFAQSPGGVTRQSYWIQGNSSPDAIQPGSLNFHPAIIRDDSKTTNKIAGSIGSMRRATIFSIYQDPGVDTEKQVWKLAGGFGDLSLSTHQVISKSRKTSIAFAKNRVASQKPGTPGAIIHTYLSRAGASPVAGNGDKEFSIQFGDPGSTGTANASNGLSYEFILYEKILNEEEIARVETYLALKYGVTLEKNYLNSLGKVVWSWENDKHYSHDIAGIGRDDRSSLYQKQSTPCQAPGQLVIAVDKIAQSNSTNKGQLNNGDYLIWGDNAQSIILSENANTATGEITLPGKKWLMKASGVSASKIATELTIDTKTMLPVHVSKDGFCLVIDRSASGNFSDGNCTYIMPDNISADGMASFSGVNWDADGSGEDVFTFGVKAVTRNKFTDSKNAGISFQLYPNPVSDGNYKMTINLDKTADIQIQVYDIQQRLLETKKATGQASYLLTGYLKAPPGTYTVRLTTGETELNQILILQ